MNTRGLLCAVALSMLTALTGCGGDGGSGGDDGDWIVGQWTAHSVSASVDGAREPVRDYGIVGRLTVASDHTYSWYEYEPSSGEGTSHGTWAYRGEGAWLFTNSASGGTTMAFRRGGEVYVTGTTQGRQIWLWFRRTAGAPPPDSPDGPPNSPDTDTIVTSRLFQLAPGREPVIRVCIPRASGWRDEPNVAWLFYRSDGQRNFELTAQSLVGVVLEQRLPNNVWDDKAAFAGPVQLDEDFTYTTSEGSDETGAVSLLFYHPPLVSEHTYHHRVQRVIKPEEAATSGTSSIPRWLRMNLAANELQTPQIAVDPEDALTEGSAPTEGVTYFPPPVLQTPEENASNQSTTSITFTWSGSVGANEYVLQVFPEDDPDGVRLPNHRAITIDDTPGTLFHTIDANFSSGSRFYWRVGARRSGEAKPLNGRLGEEGWLFSAIRSFTTASAPPPPSGTT